MTEDTLKPLELPIWFPRACQISSVSEVASNSNSTPPAVQPTQELPIQE